MFSLPRNDPSKFAKSWNLSQSSMPVGVPWMRRDGGKQITGAPGVWVKIKTAVEPIESPAEAQMKSPLEFDDVAAIDYDRNAGWSSLVARWAHNPKVGGSNPPPATTYGFGGLP